jgi:hypothetical protein
MKPKGARFICIAGVEHQRIDGSRIVSEDQDFLRNFLKAYPPALQVT